MIRLPKKLFLVFFFSLFFILLFLPSRSLFAAGGEFTVSLEGITNTPTLTPAVTPTPSSLLASYDRSILEAFIQVPPGVVTEPYIVLDAIELGVDPGVLTIDGAFSDKKFLCENVPCMVPFSQSDNISFRAYSDSGLSSEDVLAVVVVEEMEGGYLVRLSSVNRYTSFADSCYQRWGQPEKDAPTYWAEFPQFYFELNTQRTLHYLAAKLIASGIVDVSSCANGGISADLTWPTGCGLEQAKEEIIEWQNQYDPYIWTASKDIGIPPKLLKTLIQTESQFWPSNQRFYMDEYGLGQMTELGLDVLLRDDPVLFQSFCPKVLEYCNTFYINLSSENQALVRGALLSSLNATCPDCDNGFDFTKAGRSVFYVARLLQADCGEVDSIIDGFRTVEEISYEDYWKFTLFTYHSGIVCFHSAVDATLRDDAELTWENLSEKTSCIDGKSYVDGIWQNLLSFDLYSYQADEVNTDFNMPVFEAPATPTPLPTPILSSSTIQVQVFLEYPDGSMTPMSDMTVSVELDNGVTLQAFTSEKGVVTFDMSEYPASINTLVNLPGLYRSESFELPLNGTTEIVFIFASPVLPRSLP